MLTVALILAHAWQLATRRDDWPLSCYPMYASMHGPAFAVPRLYGVPESGPDVELPGETLRPLNDTLLRFALASPRNRPAVARALCGWYNVRAEAPVLAIRLEEMRWQLGTDAPPSRRTLFQLTCAGGQ